VVVGARLSPQSPVTWPNHHASRAFEMADWVTGSVASLQRKETLGLWT